MTDTRSLIRAKPETVQVYLRMRCVRMMIDDDIEGSNPSGAEIARYLQRALDEWNTRFVPEIPPTISEGKFAEMLIDYARKTSAGVRHVLTKGTN